MWSRFTKADDFMPTLVASLLMYMLISPYKWRDLSKDLIHWRQNDSPHFICPTALSPKLASHWPRPRHLLLVPPCRQTLPGGGHFPTPHLRSLSIDPVTHGFRRGSNHTSVCPQLSGHTCIFCDELEPNPVCILWWEISIISIRRNEYHNLCYLFLVKIIYLFRF